MSGIHVLGLGLWTPGFPDALAWCRRTANASHPVDSMPAPALLQGPLRRRSTLLTRIGVEALSQAAHMSGADLKSIPTVWATAHGEHSPAIELLDMMNRGEGRLSPTKFHNSVHNTASGYASIATGNRSLSTTLTGGPELVAMALLEAWCLLETRGGEVAVIVADEPLLPPFSREDILAPLAVAFVLSAGGAGSFARMRDMRLSDEGGVANNARFGALHVSAALALVETLVRGQCGVVPLQLEGTSEVGNPIWVVDVESIGEVPDPSSTNS